MAGNWFSMGRTGNGSNIFLKVHVFSSFCWWCERIFACSQQAAVTLFRGTLILHRPWELPMYLSMGRTAMDPTCLGMILAQQWVEQGFMWLGIRYYHIDFRYYQHFTQAVDSWECIFQWVVRQWIQHGATTRRWCLTTHMTTTLIFSYYQNDGLSSCSG